MVLTAAFVNNPWTIVPLYGFCLWFGMKITGAEATTPAIAWNELTFRNAYACPSALSLAFCGREPSSSGSFAAVIAYGVMYWAVVRYRKKEVELSGVS